MKFCTHCGSELADEAVLCPKCGCATDAYNNPHTPAATPKPAAPKPQKTRVYSPLSIVGFVFAFLVPLVGLICSVLAYKNAQAEGNDRCKTFAKAGLIIAAIFLAVEVATNIVYGVLYMLEIPVSVHWNIWTILFGTIY